MKRQLTLSITLILVLVLMFSGCTPESVEKHINDSIAVSGNLDYYTEMDTDAIKEKCVEQHIEVTGEVSKKVSSTLIYLGDGNDNRYYFSCSFSNGIEEYDTLEIGDVVTLHGVCTSLYESIKLINMYGCQISSINKAVDVSEETSATPSTPPTTEPITEPTTAPTTEPTTEPTTAPTTVPTTEPTTESTTAPTTEPPHEHNFSAATCTEPMTCACGKTKGKAAGHDWEKATCTTPKTCKTCGTTSGLTAGHTFSKGKCKTCGKDDPDYEQETMVWIPTNGGTKYHTHAGCSNMTNPKEVTQSKAESRGFTPCKRCH